MITIQLDETTVSPGARVKGSAVWTPDRQVSPRELRISAEWRTEGRGSTSSGKGGELRFPAGPQGFMPPVQLPFELVLPPDGPLSYDGKLIRVIWELVVRVDLPWASDEVARQTLQVVPRQA